MNAVEAFDPSGADVLRFARDELRAGRRIGFATLAGIDGSSPRQAGAQLAVAEDGRFAGCISSGCLERALIEEARAAIRRGAGGVVRYGRGSPFMDVRLPCGSGVDILFTAGGSMDAAIAACDALQARQPVSLVFGTTLVSTDPQDDDATYRRAYFPSIRVLGAGHGAELRILMNIAVAAGLETIALSPDGESLRQCAARERVLLQSPDHLPELAIDRWTACALLFHDREWDRSLVRRCLRSEAFYVGAVGGAATNALRRSDLLRLGLTDGEIERLSAPIGLIASVKDPSALAVSVLAEIVAASKAR